MSVTDRDVYAALRALLVADTGASGLNTLVTPKRFVRTNDSTTNRPNLTPYIDVTTTVGRAGDTYQAVTNLLIVVDEAKVAGAGDTPEASALLDQIVDRCRTVFNLVKPVLTGFTFGLGVEVGEATPAAAGPGKRATSLTFVHQVAAGSVTIPFAGGEGSVTLPTITGVVEAWAVEETPVREAIDLTGYDKVYPVPVIGDSIFRGWIDLTGTNTAPGAGTTESNVVFREQAGAAGITSDILIRGHQWGGTKMGARPQKLRLRFYAVGDSSGFRS